MKIVKKYFLSILFADALYIGKIELEYNRRLVMERYEIIIVGGGPAGLSAAVYTGRSELKTLLIEKGNFGGRMNDTLQIENYPSVIPLSGTGLSEKFYEHAKLFPSITFLRTSVSEIKKVEDGFIVSTKRKGDFFAETVILALGTEPRILGLPGEIEFRGRGVAYCATCDGANFQNKEVYVLGAGDQAIEEGDYLTNFARKVHIVVIHKEGKLDANQVSAARAYANPKIDFIWNSTISRVYGDKVVEGITLKNVQTAEEKDVPADGVFFFVGMVPQSAIVADLVRKDKAGYILVDKDKQTSVSGLYAVGDVTDTYVRQIATAAGDGAIAAIAAERYLSEKRTIKQLLNPESGKVAFVFYSPYDSKALAMLPNAEKELITEGYKVFRQDISRQKILYNELGLKSEFVIQKFFNGQKED